MQIIPLTQDVSTPVLTVKGVTKHLGLGPAAVQSAQIVKAPKATTTPRGFTIAFQTWALFSPDRCATKTAEDIAEMTRQFRETGFDTTWYLYAVLASTQRKPKPPHTVHLFKRHRREMAKALTKAAPSSVVPTDIAKGGPHALLTDVIANTKEVFNHAVVIDGTVISTHDDDRKTLLKATIKQPVTDLNLSTVFLSKFKELAPLLKTSDKVTPELKVLRGHNVTGADLCSVEYRCDLLIGQNRFQTCQSALNSFQVTASKSFHLAERRRS